MLGRFQALLNSKKRKIREQQRLLDRVKLDGKDGERRQLLDVVVSG